MIHQLPARPSGFDEPMADLAKHLGASSRTLEMQLPSGANIEATLTSTKQAGVAVERDALGKSARDPRGTVLRLRR